MNEPQRDTVGREAGPVERLRSTLESFHGLIPTEVFDALHLAVRDVEEGERGSDAAFAAAADTFEKLDSELNRINAEAKALRDRLLKRISSATDAEIEAELVRMGVDPKALDARARQFIAATKASLRHEREANALDAPAFRAIDERTRVTAANIRGAK